MVRAPEGEFELIGIEALIKALSRKLSRAKWTNLSVSPEMIVLEKLSVPPEIAALAKTFNLNQIMKIEDQTR